MSKGSSALSISRGLVGPKSIRNSKWTTGKLVNIPVPSPLNANASGNTEPDSRPVESGNFVEAVTARTERIPKQRKSVVPGAREKASAMSVPRSDTGAHGGESLGLSGTTDVREFGKLVP